MTAVPLSRASLVQAQVRAAYQQTIGSKFPEGIALLAVGGFGRAELFPFSDVDILLLVEYERLSVPIRDDVSRFLQMLWDSGLRVSQSVHTLEECLTLDENNVEFAISLLDRRFLTGEEALSRRLEERMPQFLRGQRNAIQRKLAAITRLRHGKFQNSIYHLEPNIKDGPGGLRDLQVLGWLTALGGDEDGDLATAHEFLSNLRTRLHMLAARDQNILNFEAQDHISGHPAELMRSYYRHARAVYRGIILRLDTIESAASGLLSQFRDRLSRLSNSEFTVSKERVYLRHPATLDDDPRVVIRLFQFVARHGIRLAPDTIRRLASNPPHAEVEWSDWREILGGQHPSAALRAMQASDMLARLLPEWANIEYLVVRDFHHRYSVDEHTIVAVESFDHFEDKRFANLLSEVDDPALLRFALLLHDIGKGGGNHVTESQRLAEAIFERLRIAPAQRAHIRFLVARHLEISTIMNSRDLDDRETARLLASRVETVERLKLLTLVTYADISAVHPTAMTPWKREQLWRAYLAAHHELTRELESERIHHAAGRPEFLEGFPTRYLRTHSAEEIAADAALAERSAGKGVAFSLEHDKGVYHLRMITRDRPALFAHVAGALASFGMNILKAEAFANTQGQVLDTFAFADPIRTLELNPGEDERMLGVLERVVLGKTDLDQLLRGRPRPALPSRKAAIAPSVAFDQEASSHATLIEITAQDRPGLLYDVARTLSAAACSIDIVLIDTEAHKALDVFYVTWNGGKLPVENEASLRDALLLALNG